MKLLYSSVLLMLAATISYSATFYSINSGSWENPYSWSNESHYGKPAGTYPNSISDTVYIDNKNIISFYTKSVTVAKLSINNGALYVEASNNKKLTITNYLYVGQNGTFRRNAGTGSIGIDTLAVAGTIENRSTLSNIISLYNTASDQMMLSFEGNTSSIITGEGNWLAPNVRINKTYGLKDTVTNNSKSFSNNLSAQIDAYLVSLSVLSGVYYHNNSAALSLSPDDADGYTLGKNSGLFISQGTINCGVSIVMGDSASFSLTGGIVNIGASKDQNLLYGIDNYMKVSGGELHVAGVFAQNKSNSSVNFVMSGGIMEVMKYGVSISNIKPSFSINASSVFTRNFDDNPAEDQSRIIIAGQHSGGALSYSVQTSNYDIKGGTVQFGVEGNYLNSKFQDFTISTIAPNWNIDIVETRYSTTAFGALIQMTSQMRVLNKLDIRANGAFDLNCNNLIMEGMFFNYGRFTPDGEGNNTTGLKKVTFIGTAEQKIQWDNPVVNKQGTGTVNNEPFYDVEINKTGGSLYLSPGANNDIVIRNSLVFTSANTVPINGRTYDKYVEMRPVNTGDKGTITRSGKGHIDGRLRLPVSDTSQALIFFVGAGTDYTPVRLDFNGSGSNTGKIEVCSNPVHPASLQANGLNIDTNKSVKRYWNVQAVDNYNLGSRTFDLTLQFVTAKDIRNGADWNNFRQFDCSQAPYLMLTEGTKSNMLNQSLGNVAFGNFFIAEEPIPVIAVQGTVRSQATKTPIANASVEFTNTSDNTVKSAVTDATGTYSLNLDEGSQYIARASSGTQYIPVYYNGTQNITEAEPVVANANLGTVDFLLKAVPTANNSIAGRVVDKSNTAVPASVVAYLIKADNYDITAQYEARTYEAIAGKGVFQISGLSPGRYVLQAVPVSPSLVPGYYLKSNFAVFSWLNATVIEIKEDTKSIGNVIKLMDLSAATGTGSIHGTIIGEELKVVAFFSDVPNAKKSVSGAMTFTVDENDKVRKYDFSDKNGSYIMDGLPEGAYDVIADKVGYELSQDNINVDGDTENDVELIPWEETGVEDELFVSRPLFRPNPATDALMIFIDSRGFPVHASLSDVHGRLLSEFTSEPVSSVLKLDIAGLVPGTYYVRLNYGNMVGILSFIAL